MGFSRTRGLGDFLDALFFDLVEALRMVVFVVFEDTNQRGDRSGKRNLGIEAVDDIVDDRLREKENSCLWLVECE